jgi:hypothetical protein
LAAGDYFEGIAARREGECDDRGASGDISGFIGLSGASRALSMPRRSMTSNPE